MELLKGAKEGAEILSVGKFAGRHTLPQEKINQLLVEKAREGKTVVRLKGGDCYLFGRGGEEVEACYEAGVDFEVVPGVTSALAAPAYAGIPPTHRDYTSSIAVVTGHRKKGDDRPIDIPKAGTWYDQRVIKGTLANFLDIAEKAVLRTPGIFIVGKVVELQDRLDWFSKRPNVLVLGNHPQRYKHLGNIVHRRIIDCVAIDDYTEADAMFTQIEQFDWIVFTSVNGAKYLFQRLSKMGKDTRSLAGAKIGAIGKTTAVRLNEYGIIADLIPKNESSTGLLEEFARLDMAGKKVLLPQAEISSRELPEGLAASGAQVTAVPVYKTVEIEPDEVDFDYIDIVLFTSGSTVRAFVNRFGKLPPNTKALALGIPTQNVAKEHGIDAELMSQA